MYQVSKNFAEDEATNLQEQAEFIGKIPSTAPTWSPSVQTATAHNSQFTSTVIARLLFLTGSQSIPDTVTQREQQLQTSRLSFLDVPEEKAIFERS